MKQPKFRGFSYETNSWQYGFGWFETDYTDEYLEECRRSKQDAILLIDSGHTVCDIDSMAQYAGWQDINGEDIYQDDIVIYTHCSYTDCSRSEIEHVADPVKGKIYFAEGLWPGIQFADGTGIVFQVGTIDSTEFEVIGNVHENKKLLDK